MSNFSDFIGGGGGGGLYGGVIMEIPLTRSQTFVPPRNGTVNIICVGAGGGGAYTHGTGGTIATGGGAGGLCIKEGLDVTTSGSFTITIGSGGAGKASNSQVNGNDGGNTTVSGTGLSSTLTANGGGGGRSITTTESGAAGGTGGTASNGNFNRTGGAGGSVGAGIVTSSEREHLDLSTGGGAVAILTSTGYAGGSFTLAGGGTQITNDHYFASGGAGIGGRGGGVHEWDGNLDANLLGFNGGGSNYAGYDHVDQYDWATSVSSAGRGEAFAFPYIGASFIGQTTAVGGAGNHGGNAPTNGGGIRQSRNNADGNYFTFEGHTNPVGAGGGGYTGSTDSIRSAYGGAFAGGGGTTHYANSSLQGQRSGDGGVGGGGGGFVSFASSAQYGLSGYGGPGMVFIHYTAYA